MTIAPLLVSRRTRNSAGAATNARRSNSAGIPLIILPRESRIPNPESRIPNPKSRIPLLLPPRERRHRAADRFVERRHVAFEERLVLRLRRIQLLLEAFEQTDRRIGGREVGAARHVAGTWTD